ncbi:MAG: rod shape-determining protein MreD [Clostridiales bacterium]|jgi:rod shape-determining protein mreD|nr:rod shape-determining protein MreD [Clostridiales bacterium]
MKSRKHIIFYILSAVFLALVQEAFFNDLRIFGVKPNLTLALLCVVAVRMNFTEAMIYGLSTGLFVDIVYGRYIGFYGLLYMYLAILIVFITSMLNYGEKLWWPIAVAPLPLLLYGVLESFIARLLAVYTGEALHIYSGGFWTHFGVRILPVAFYNCICIAVLMVPIIKFLDRKSGGFQ